MNRDTLFNEITRHVTELMEHCETVRIIVTAELDESPGETDLLTQGDGNWYAQYGSAKKWVLSEEHNFSRWEDVP